MRCGGPALTAFFLFEIRPHWPSAATDYPALEKVLSGRCRWFPAPLVRNLLLSADTLPREKARLSPLPTQSVHILRLFTFFAPLDRGPIPARGVLAAHTTFAETPLPVLGSKADMTRCGSPLSRPLFYVRL